MKFDLNEINFQIWSYEDFHDRLRILWLSSIFVHGHWFSQRLKNCLEVKIIQRSTKRFCS